MTLRASSVKRTAVNLFLCTVRKNIGIIALVTVFMLLVCPGYMLVDINNNYDFGVEVYELEYIFEGLNFALTFLTCCIAGISCIINFSFVYSKKSGDLYFALPTTRNGLLLSRFAASLVPALIPIILCYTAMGIVLLSENVTGDATQILIGALISIMLVIMTGCVTMLFIVCAGSIIDFFISFFGLNIGVFAISAMLLELFDLYLRGFYYGGADGLLFSTSPFLYAFYTLEKVYTSKNGFIFDTRFVIFVSRVIITAVVCLAVSILLFRKRKAEKCTAAYAYRGMYYVCSLVFSFAAAFVFGLIFSGDARRITFWIFSVFGAVLGAITFGLITDRGFKTLKKSVMTGAVSYLLLVAAVIILKNGGFGYSNRVPLPENVESVSVSCNYNSIRTEFTSPELVIALHKKAVESEEIEEVETVEAYIEDSEKGYSETETEQYQNHTTIIQLEYKLKNGFEMKRSFWVRTSDCDDEILAVYQSKENINAIKKTAYSILAPMNIYGDLNNAESYFDTTITRAECEMLIGAYTQDLLEADTDMFYEINNCVYINGTTTQSEYTSIDLEIYESFDKTQSALESLNLIERTEMDNR